MQGLELEEKVTMKRDRVCVLAFFIILFLGWGAGRSVAEKAKVAWVKNYEGGYEVVDLVVDSSGNVYVTGTTFPPSGSDFVTIKYNSSGEEQWIARYGKAERDDAPAALKVDRAGNVYVTGDSHGGSSAYDMLTIKYNPSGKLVWSKRLNNPENNSDYANDITVDKAGNVYVTGASEFDATEHDIVTVKYSSSGKLKWAKRLVGPAVFPNRRDDFGRRIETDSAGNIYVTGWSDASSADIVTIKFSGSGQVLWDRRYDGPDHMTDEPSGLAVGPGGIAYVVGSSNGSSSQNIVLIKYSASGEQQWAQRYELRGGEANDIFLDKSGNVYVTGSGNFSGNSKFVTLKYDPTGARKWVALYSTVDGSAAYSIDGDESGNVYVTGSGETKAVSYEIVTIKYDAQGKKKWAAIYSGPTKWDRGRAVALDPSGAVIVAGESRNAGWVIVKYIQEP
jgi:uncharacterized delta-60 repeat protein